MSTELFDLSGRTALVTGGTHGIGMAIGVGLARAGAKLCVNDILEERLASCRDEYRARGVDVYALRFDVTSEPDVARGITEIEQAVGPIDILVNNAGIGLFGAFQDKSEADWDTVLDTNLKSVFLVSREVAPEMIRRKTGHIINISSLAGKSTFANGAIYCASKWGLMGLTGCMAEDLRAHGIRVSVICPGSVATDFSGQSAKDPAKMLQPGDVAHAVAALVTQAPGSFISEVHIRPTRKP